jgi:hypothetical protein
VSDDARQTSAFSGHQVLAAGFAAATAAFVTSRFGVAGTLLGAALTAMIITGGSAILRAYFEGVTGNVRNVPKKVRTRANRLKAMRYGEPDTLPERPDLRDNFVGRMRAAMGWFSHLPPLSRRSILIKGLIAAAIAFVIGMGAVYAVEKGIGNSLSCGLWSNCPEGAKPGIHLLGDRDAGAGSSISLGRANTKTAAWYGDQAPDQGPDYQQNQQNVFQQQQQEDRSFRQESPGYRQPADSGGGESRRQSGGGILESEPQSEPQVEQEGPAQQQETPSTASPAPEEEPVQEVAPSGESPAPSQPSGESPAPSQ